MKLHVQPGSRVRIEMLPLIDIVFLLLVFFIYAMLSMAVHRSLPVRLPSSTTSKIDQKKAVAVTAKKDGTVYVEGERVSLDSLPAALRERSQGGELPAVMLFAEKTVSYQELFRILDQVRVAGIQRISLQAEGSSQP